MSRLMKKAALQAVKDGEEVLIILEQISKKLDPNHPAERMTIDEAKEKISQATEKLRGSLDWMAGIYEV